MQANYLGYAIKEARNQRQLSQEEVARWLRRDRSWVAHLERGDLVPSEDQVLALARGFGVEPTPWLAELGADEVIDSRDNNMRRRLVRRFAQTEAGVERQRPAGHAPRWKAMASDMLDFLRGHVSDERLRAKLIGLRLGCREAAVMALTLLRRGAQWARLSWANVSFPLAVIDEERCCVNHVERRCLLWSDSRCSLALFGEYFGLSPRYLPPVLAWSDQERRRYLLLYGGGRSGENSSGAPAVSELSASSLHHSAVERLCLRGASSQRISAWVDALMGGE